MSKKTLEKNNHLKVSNLIFSSGNKIEENNYDIQCGNIVILVGPNNSGKTTVLREIENYCLGGNKELKILSDIQFNTPLTDDGITELINTFRVQTPPPGQNMHTGEFLLAIPDFKGDGKNPQYQRIVPESITNFLQTENLPRENMNNHIIKFFTILLDGETRFDLIKNKPRGDLKIPPANPLSKIFREENIHKNIDQIIYDEFDLHFYLDSTGMNGDLQISFNQENFSNWKSQDESAIEFFTKSTPITDLGDGVKIFTGLLIAAMSLPHKIFLVDEPEAFLHPPKARSLGTHLTNLIEKRDASLIISTHSPDFVLGCLDESNNVTIIRLTYDGNNGTTRHLGPSQVLQLTTDPILRATETFSALFHDSAIVVEDHTDRVFYKEIFNKFKKQNQNQDGTKQNDQLLKVNDAVFLNTNGKNRIHRIVGPLRKIGIPTAAIYDLDVIRHESNNSPEGSLWKTVLKHANVPKFEWDKLESARFELEQNLTEVKESDMIPFKRLGLEKLKESKKTQGKQLLSELKKYGIFIIPIGELESWSADMISEEPQKSHWLEDVLQKLDSDKTIKLSEKRIWEFMTELNSWLINSDRLGMFVQASKSISI